MLCSRGDSGHGCLPKLIMNQFRWLDRVINAKVTHLHCHDSRYYLACTIFFDAIS